MSLTRGAPRRSVIRGVRGLGNIVYLSAVLTTLAQVHGVGRIRKVRTGLGEIEIEGRPSRAAVGAALAGAAAMMADLRADAPAGLPASSYVVDDASRLPLEVVELDDGAAA